MLETTEYANSVFEQPWWLNIVAPGKWRESFALDKKGNVIARLAYVADNKNVYMPKLTQTLGIWMAQEIRSDYGAQKAAINEIYEDLRGYSSINIALGTENQYVLPFRWLGFRIEPGFSYRLSNLSDCDALYRNFGSTAKKNIKSAKNKVTISDKTDVDTLWEMLNKTFEAQNRKNPMSKELVFKIVEKCEATGHGKYFDARDPDGNVHACAYFVYDEKVCYYLLGASDSKYRSSGAQSLILWHGIQFAAEHSAEFDFEGSMIEGIEHFFKQFGGKCLPYFSVKKQSLLQEIMDTMKPRIKRIIGYKN